MISFVGAGPGAADLLTLRGVNRLQHADVVLWAGSLVSPEVLVHCRPEATLFDTKSMTLEDVVAVYGAHPDAAIVRLHSGDPAWYSAIGEQIDWCLTQGRDCEVVPGVSSVSAAAAAIRAELTIPGISQTVVLTRLARRTAASMGPGEDLVGYAAQGGLLALFLSAGDPERLQATLLAPGSAYNDTTPVVIAHRVSWPDEQLVATNLGALAQELRDRGITTSALVLVGNALAPAAGCIERSHVYDPAFSTQFREASQFREAPR